MTGWRRRVLVIGVLAGAHLALSLPVFFLNFGGQTRRLDGTVPSLSRLESAISHTHDVVLFPISWSFYLGLPGWLLLYGGGFIQTSLLWAIVLYGSWSVIQKLRRRRRRT